MSGLDPVEKVGMATKPKTTRVTLAAAKKQLAKARVKADEGVGIYGKACLGHRVSNLECGNRYRKERAVSRARQVVDAMEAAGVQEVERLVIQGDHWMDPGFSTVYVSGAQVLLVVHSSADKVGLGKIREAKLAAFLAERKAGGTV